MKNAVLLCLYETVLRTILNMNKYRAGASDRNMTCTCFCLINKKFLSSKMLRKDTHFAEMKYMLRIPLERERVACDSLFNVIGNSYFNVTKRRGVFVIIHENMQRSNKSEERT